MKTALITGASGGIGSKTVLWFLQNGYFVAGWYNNGEEEMQRLKREIDRIGKSDYFLQVKADLTDTASIIAGFSATLKSFSHIDVLVNNAGVSLYKLMQDTAESEWDKVFDINAKSAFTLSKLCVPKMVERKSGRIVNVSSVWGLNGACMESVYSASKSALIGFTKALAKELAPSGITVNCICPGVIDTKMNAIFSPDEINEIKTQIPVMRLGKPEEVASLIGYLAGENSGYITGQVISCDGGYAL